MTIPSDALLSSRDFKNFEDRAIEIGPARIAIKKSITTTIASDSIYLPQSVLGDSIYLPQSVLGDSIYLPQSVLSAANKTMSSLVPSS
jgi:hypothetical protein